MHAIGCILLGLIVIAVMGCAACGVLWLIVKGLDAIEFWDWRLAKTAGNGLLYLIIAGFCLGFAVMFLAASHDLGCSIQGHQAMQWLK